MAQISISVSTQHGSTITVSPMLDDECLCYEATTYIRSATHPEIEPWIYARDSVSFHGDPAAIRLLLEKLFEALDARTKGVPA